MKIHHVIGDGLGIMLMMSMLQDAEYKPSMFI
jgi:diacylglycerol O-acyltransferase / wax synthase